MIPRVYALSLLVAPFAGSILAQDLGYSTVVLHKPLVCTVAGPGVQASTSMLAAGSNVLAGLGSSCNVAGGGASAWGMFQVSDQTLSMSIDASALVNGAVLPNGSASSGDPALDIHLQVPRAMPVRFQLGAFSASSLGAGAGRASIDIVGYGGVELELVGQPGLCVGENQDLVLDLPAGPVVIRVVLEASLPVGLVGTDCQLVQASANLLIRPAHASIEHGPGGCGASLELTPLLDGQGVRCYVGPSYPTSAVWLVFGLQPLYVTLPVGPGCPLLVDPLVVLPIQPMAYTTLPVAVLGRIELMVQGMMLQPQNPWLPAAGLLTSHRATISVR